MRRRGEPGAKYALAHVRRGRRARAPAATIVAACCEASLQVLRAEPAVLALCPRPAPHALHAAMALANGVGARRNNRQAVPHASQSASNTTRASAVRPPARESSSARASPLHPETEGGGVRSSHCTRSSGSGDDRIAARTSFP